MTDHIVRHILPGDEYGIVDLLEITFNPWPNYSIECEPMEHWRWKYQDSPNATKSSVVCESEGKIIGCKHDVVLKLKIGNEILFGNLGSDLAVHPDHRRKGISTKLRELNRASKKEVGYEFTYFVTSNPILIEHYQKTREPFPYTIFNYVKIFDIDLQLEKMPVKGPLIKKYGFLSLEVLNKVRNVFTEKNETSETKIISITFFDELYNRFWQKEKQSYDFIINRDIAYMNWRYADPKGGNYSILKAEKEDEFTGYIILYINRIIEDYPIGYIVDIMTDGNDETTYELVSAAIDFFKTNDVNIINCLTLRGHHHEKALQQNGFVNSMIGLKIFLGRHGTRSNDENLLSTLRIAKRDRVHFSYGDIDSLPSALPNY